MKFNGTDVIVKVHTTRDEQEIVKYLESLDRDIIDVRISASQLQDWIMQYTVVTFIKKDV